MIKKIIKKEDHTVNVSDGVSSMGSIIDGVGFDLALKFVSFVIFIEFRLYLKLLNIFMAHAYLNAAEREGADVFFL